MSQIILAFLPFLLGTHQLPAQPASGATEKHEVKGAAPQWMRCKYVHPLDQQEYQGYIRAVVNYSYRFEKDFVTRRSVAINHGAIVTANESDSETELAVTLTGTDLMKYPLKGMHFVRKLNEKGMSRRQEASIGNVDYFDLNGDGLIDAWVDRRGSVRTIHQVRDGMIVNIGESKSPFLDLPPPVPASIPRPREKPKLRLLGPEWIKVSTTYSGRRGGPPVLADDKEFTRYLRPGANISYRKENDHTTRHTLILDQGGGIDVYERDDRSAVTIELIGKKPGERLFSFTRHVNEKGKPTRHEARFGLVTYFDLDGDGMIDCWVDRRKNEPESFILFERRVVKIEDPNAMLFAKPKGVYSAWSRERKSKYEFIVPVAKWIPAKP